MVKKILSILLWVVTGAGLIALFIFGRQWYRNLPLQGIHLTVEREHAKGFIETDSFYVQVQKLCDLRHQASIADIDLTALDKMFNDNPWIAQSSAYIDLNDTLNITIKEYEPAVRVFNQKGQSIYVTREGVIIPTSSSYTPRLIIASGAYTFTLPEKNRQTIDSAYRDEGLAEALAISQVIAKDEFLREHIGQIYRNNDKEYEVIVNNLPIQVLLGDTCAVSNKLHRLKTLLEKYQGTEELEAYKTMNLKYKNQIVCTKK